MNAPILYALTGIALYGLALYALIRSKHLLRRILALNIMGSGVFLVMVALAQQHTATSDPVPQAMVITGIVVAVSATAVALVLMVELFHVSGVAELPDAAER